MADVAPIECRGLERRYGRRIALAGVDLDVAAGEIVGLVGPNGSGKTTLLRILAGFLRPHAGAVRVLGLEPFVDRPALMRRTRFAFAPPALFDALTAREHMTHLVALHGTRVERREIDAALDTVGLLERADDRVRAFSFGMRQRLAIAQALLPRPELLVLDEPTDGLDPEAVRELREVLAGLRAEHGVAILLSSHLLTEVERLVDRMLVLAEGETVFCGTPEELTAPRRKLVLVVDDAARAHTALAELDGELVDEHTLELAPGALTLEAARTRLAAADVALEAFHERAPGLEEALMARLAERAGSAR